MWGVSKLGKRTLIRHNLSLRPQSRFVSHQQIKPHVETEKLGAHGVPKREGLGTWAFSMTTDGSDTVYALSSAPGRAAISLIRVTGPQASKVFSAMTYPKTVPKERQATLRSIRVPGTDEEIDKGIVIFFPGPNSFTGEDMVEFHIHGSIAVVNAMLEALPKMGFGMAGPGEFSQRAFRHGKMDISSVEGLSDLINSETQLQRRQALWQMAGGAEDQYNKWVAELTRALATIEALIDFGDDEQIEVEVLKNVLPRLNSVQSDIEKHLGDGKRGEMIRSGIHVAIVGPPNVGKSSLINLLAKRPASIVSPIKGTTRDVVEVRMDIGGYPVVIADTAGLNEEASDEIELEGMERARERFKGAAIRIVVYDISNINNPETFSEEFKQLLSLDGSQGNNAKTIVVFNKVDLHADSEDKKAQYSMLKEKLVESLSDSSAVHFMSCAQGEGVYEFLSELERVIGKVLFTGETTSGHGTLITRARHRKHLEETSQAISKTLETIEVLEISSEHLKQGIDAIGRITGRVDIEDVLDVLFQDFCIGK